MIKLTLIMLVAVFVVADAKTLTELKNSIANLDLDNIDCKSTQDILDECGLQQGYSVRFEEFGYPLNHTFLLSSCRRQGDALKCLRAYAKCLPPLSRQVLIAMVHSRQRYNKRICTEKPTETATKLIEFTRCLQAQESTVEKGLAAEISSITIPEAIMNTKIESIQETVKLSCCSVAKVRKDYMDAILPACVQYFQVASDVIDSYLADTVGIICPNFEKNRQDCEKIPKLNIQKTYNARFFIKPIVNVIQTLG